MMSKKSGNVFREEKDDYRGAEGILPVLILIRVAF
jgi:hypothetical protein